MFFEKLFVVYQINLAMQTLSKLNMVCRLENLFQTLYAYFSESPKKHLEFNKLVEIMETQDNKLLKKSQNKVDLYARTCKEGDEGILHSNGQDDFGFC